MSGSAMTGDGQRVVVDDASVYDALIGLNAIAQPRLLGRGPWREWAETTASALSVEHWRRLRRWFAESGIGLALMALAPLLTRERDLAELADTLEALPLGDMARVAVTSELIAPQTPLDADDLLALQGDQVAARRFCDRYVRAIGRRRTALLRALVAPEEARAELLSLLREYDAQVFTALAPRLADERERAATALRAQIAQDGGLAPAFIRERDDLQGFSPVILGISTLLGDSRSLYYHDVDRTLIDGRDYEPFITIIGTRKALGLSRRRGGPSAEGSDRFADPAIRWAALYTALADPSRLLIVRLLVERPRYGQELAEALGMSGATISHHLNALSKAGALGVERRAHRTYFVLDHEALRGLLRQAERFALGESGKRGEQTTPADDTSEAHEDTHEGMA